MEVERYERYWMWAATGMLVLFTGAIVATAVAGSAHPPSHTETVDPETLTVSGEFASPGVVIGANGGVTVSMRAELCVFRPAVVRVPAGRSVTIRITSRDVIHGFQVVGTNINLTVAPGYVSEVTNAIVQVVPIGETSEPSIRRQPLTGPASSTPPMAATSCDQRSRSRTSCFFPAAVSR